MEKGKKFLFISTSRATDNYYGFEPEEKNLLLEDFRNVELVEGCSAYFGVSVEGEVTEKILEVGDGTPFYVISLFATLEEQGKTEITLEDLETLPRDSFNTWCNHLEFLEGKEKLSTSEQYVLRSIALAMHAARGIAFGALEGIYGHVFRGKSYFKEDLDKVIKKFFIGKEDGLYFIHAIQVEAVESKYPLDPIEHYIRGLRKVLTSLEGDKSLAFLWRFASWLHESEKYGGSLELWDALITKEPNLDQAYGSRGNTYAKLNQHERAIEDYSAAIKLNPNLVEAYNNRGVAYAELNQHERAIEDYSDAIKLNPNLVEAYNNRGNAYTKLRRYERAIEDYSKAIKLGLECANIYDNRGCAYARLEGYKSAIEDYSKAIKLDSEYAGAYDHRAIVYLKLGECEKAIEDYDKLIELIPTRVEAYNNRGNVYTKLRRYERAIEEYSKAIKLDSEYAESYCNRGLEYSVVGKYDESVRDLKTGGFLFLKSARRKDAEKSFVSCFNLRDEIENGDVIYCGLALFFLTLNADLIIEIRKMQVEDEALKEILDLTLRKLNKEDVSEEIKEMESREERDEIKILLTLVSHI